MSVVVISSSSRRDMCGRVFTLFLVLTLHFGDASNENIIAENIKDRNMQEHSFIEDESLIECVVDLTQMTLVFTPTILILVNEKDDYDDTLFMKIIKTLAKRDVPVVIQGKHSHKVIKKLDVYDRNVIVIVNFEKLDELLIFKMDYDKRVKYLVIISEIAEDYNSIITLQHLRQQLIERDVTFMMHNKIGKNYDIITFIPIMNDETCQYMDKIEPKLINICRDGSLGTDAVFPVETRIDFKNCSLKVGMATMFPMSQIPDEDKLKNFDLIHNIEGSDVEIIKIIANYFNASIVWHYLHRDQANPYSNKEYVVFITNGSLDASAGGLYRIYGDLISYSGIYDRQAVTWVYAAHRNSRSWVNLMHKLHEMYLFYLIYLCYSVSSYIFHKYDHERLSLKDILLYSWGSLTGGSSLPEPKSLKHKILNISYLVLCIYWSVYINIQLVSFLTVDGPSITFKTNEDVVNSGRTPYLNDKNKYFIDDSKYCAFANTSRSCDGFYDCINKTLDNDGLAVILDEYFYAAQASTAVKDEAKILKATQNILTIYHEMLIKKDSLIVVGFQKVMERLFEAGICDHLFKKAIGITVVAKADSASKNAVSNSYSCALGCAITLSQVAGLFYVWALGCVLSVSVFLFEMLCKSETIRFIKY